MARRVVPYFVPRSLCFMVSWRAGEGRPFAATRVYGLIVFLLPPVYVHADRAEAGGGLDTVCEAT